MSKIRIFSKKSEFLAKTDDVRANVKNPYFLPKNPELHSKRGLIISLIDLGIVI